MDINCLPEHVYYHTLSCTTVYASVEEAVKDLKLDRRRKWYYFYGGLIRDEKYKAPCWDCEGAGCSTCGYQKNTWQYAPVPAIDKRNGNPVIILNLVENGVKF